MPLPSDASWTRYQAKRTTESQLPFSPQGRYTFASFVEGNCNREALRAFRAIAQGQARFASLFLHGASGLGKTHLALALQAALEGQGITARYITSEAFTAEFLDAVRRGHAFDLHDMYVRVQVLIVDDIQFLSGLAQTQTQFARVVRERLQHCRKIVLTADRPPAEIAGLDSDLVSRSLGGCCVEVQRPAEHTRHDILKYKLSRYGLPLAPPIIAHIARVAEGNVRVLEGVLQRLLALRRLLGYPLDEASVRQALGEMGFGAQYRSLRCEDVLEQVACYCSVSARDLRSRRRTHRTAYARHLTMYLCREILGSTYERIGRALKRDHSTVLTACRNMGQRMDHDPALQEDLTALQAILAEAQQGTLPLVARGHR